MIFFLKEAKNSLNVRTNSSSQTTIPITAGMKKMKHNIFQSLMIEPIKTKIHPVKTASVACKG